MTGDRFRSNYGKGPLTARILSVVGGRVYMERWRNDPSRAVSFDLSIDYLASPKCGWRKYWPAPTPETERELT